MPQDYNVDDILEEIRRKKSRATTSSEAPQHSTYGEETGYSPARPAQRQARPAQGQAPVPRAKNGLADSPQRPSSAGQSSSRQQPPAFTGYGDIQPLGSRRSRPSAGTAGQPYPGSAPVRKAAPPRSDTTYSAEQRRAPRTPESAGFAFHTGTGEENGGFKQNTRAQFDFDAAPAPDRVAFPDMPDPFAQQHPRETDGFSFQTSDPTFSEDPGVILPPDEGLGGETWEASEPLPAMDGSFGFDFSADVMAETEASAAQRRSRPPYREFEQQQAPQMKGFDYPDDSAGFAAQEQSGQDLSEDDPYATPEDAAEAEKEVRSARVGAGIRMTVVGILAVLSVYLGFSLHPLAFAEKLGVPNGLLFLPPFMLPEQDMRMFLIGSLVVCVLAGIICSDVISRGITSLCRMQANCDSPVSLAFLGVMIQGIMLVIFPDEISKNPSVSLYFPVAVILLFFSAAGRRMQAARVERNFRCIAAEGPKYAFEQIEDREFAREFSRGLGPDVDRVAYSTESRFISGFFSQNSAADYCDGFSRLVSPICLAGALVVGILTFILAKDPATAVSAAAAILCICAPFSGAVIQNQMLSKMSKRLTRKGAMLSGYDAAEEFSETGAVIISDRDLFSEENVMLHGMKVFAEKRIDEAILDAASVILSCDGVMSGVFLNMIGGNRAMLKKVDSLSYEDSMGISAWVNGKRVLIGSHELMRRHEVDCPSKDFESRYARDGRRVLYLANSGELTAMFVVSYNADPETAEILTSLERHGVFASVYTSDPNITGELISLAYGVKKSSIRILPAKIHAEYQELVRPKARTPAKGVHAGGLAGMQLLLKAASAVRRSVVRSTILQLIGIIVGYGLVAFMAFSGSLSSAPFSTLIVFHLGWLVINWIAASIVKW